jgi:FO synthase
MRRRVTYSRNVTLSLSRTCRCHCKYCAFATHQPHLHEPGEVEQLLDRAARRGVKELLVLTGEAPDHHPGVRRKLEQLGFADFTAYVVWCCERGLERGLLPHTNLGVLAREDLARLREVTRLPGPMLESTVADSSPTRDRRPSTRSSGWRRSAPRRAAHPVHSGILVGIGETRPSARRALEALAAVHAEHGHLQESSCRTSSRTAVLRGRAAEIAEQARPRPLAHGLWRARARHAGWATPVTLEDMVRCVGEAAARLLPDVGIQVPPNLADWWPELVAAGATDLGGLSANGDHISPEHPFPSPHQVRKRLAKDGVALTGAPCVYPQYLDPEWVAQGVLDVVKAKFWSFIPRKGSGRREERVIRPRPRAGGHRQGRDGAWLDPEELTALFAETARRRSRTSARPRTSCAPSSRETR